MGLQLYRVQDSITQSQCVSVGGDSQMAGVAAAGGLSQVGWAVLPHRSLGCAWPQNSREEREPALVLDSPEIESYDFTQSCLG